jgi:peptidyl-tRNA hydrolase
MKMYILIKRDVPDKFVPVIAAHASLACYKKFENDPLMTEWIKGIFTKVVCVVNEKEFDNAKSEEKNVVLTESMLDNKEVALAFCPREVYSKQFKFFKIWGPSGSEI